ncbi:hypothetical protein THAOC_12760 [Thalassiosira oceanica]|uniref:Uncharacterized protein n=1 Tax=Thalassiosira oceanica TaxID=159749 RepID=K0SZ68_THAOC|nr:hypothetical protein THAOC_12760 [Thalassiosira oceanica]|eukprot:EJK66331.1 hypothetical protein THAOC_12760 [Thalassiosira oceanica]
MTNSGVLFRMVCSVSRWEHVERSSKGVHYLAFWCVNAPTTTKRYLAALNKTDLKAKVLIFYISSAIKLACSPRALQGDDGLTSHGEDEDEAQDPVCFVFDV